VKGRGRSHALSSTIGEMILGCDVSNGDALFPMTKHAATEQAC
jgi:hypothetical protein